MRIELFTGDMDLVDKVNKFIASEVERGIKAHIVNITSEVIHNKLLSLHKNLSDANELILDLFAQATLVSTQDRGRIYDNLCISTYEHAQDYLIGVGMVKEEECSRK